jgi:hypothetical protein
MHTQGVLPFVGLHVTKHPQIFLVLLATSGHARPPLLITTRRWE